MRIVITGGAGCLGSKLTERYLERGDDILVIDNFATGHRGSLPDAHPHMTIIEGSVADRALLGRTFAAFAPTGDITLEMVGKTATRTCSVEQSVLTLFR